MRVFHRNSKTATRKGLAAILHPQIRGSPGIRDCSGKPQQPALRVARTCSGKPGFLRACPPLSYGSEQARKYRGMPSNNGCRLRAAGNTKNGYSAKHGISGDAGPENCRKTILRV
jgi:hypothetical protein